MGKLASVVPAAGEEKIALVGPLAVVHEKVAG